MANWENVPPMDAVAAAFQKFGEAADAVSSAVFYAAREPEKHRMLVTEEEAQTIWGLRNGTVLVIPAPRKANNAGRGEQR